ncbi:MAG: response regulator [Clostridiales bacterium]|nr:response regulator [Clostridiales bacterium]
MRHYHIQFYLIGGQQDIWARIKEAPPLEHFTHTFAESVEPDTALLAQADVIFADLRGMDAGKTLPVLTAGKRAGAELILLAGQTQVAALAEIGGSVTDIWTVPMSAAEVRFRFEKRQQILMMDKLQDRLGWEEKGREIEYQEQLFKIFSAFLSDNVDDVYLILNETGTTVEFVTPNVERVLGVSAEDILNDAWAIGHAEYITGYEVGNEGLMALEPGMALEPMETKRIDQKTGEEKWFRESVYCVSVQGAKKNMVYISDRTREQKSREELGRALEMAQVANKAKSTFLSNVSHDIRTPMNAIMGFSALLREEASNPASVLEYAQKISAAGQHLMGLLNDVLDMSRMESGKAALSISELNLADLMDELNTIIRPQAKAKYQSFEIFTVSLIHEDLLGDKLRISQILTNILSNAVKYTQTGGKIKMWVTELPQVDKEYARIRFAVSDNGQGMSEECQKAIFTPFARQQSTAWNKMQGSGMGMAITKSLVDLMDGSIRVTSAVGAGSIFEVELELRIQEDRNDGLRFWAEHNIRRLLIVDDDADICRDIVRKMAGTGVDVQYANDGARTIEMLQNAQEDGRPYDLVLMDWKMPDLDGLATARLIRLNSTADTPILLFTAYDWADIEAEAAAAGIKYFLSKPFFMRNFQEAVQRMMGSEEKKAPAAAGESIVKGRYVLVVDDIDVNRMILVKIMTALGAKCDTAENGQEAVEKFIASRPGEYDLILMDVQMPYLNGHEATQAIRAADHPSAKTVPIIAMTANAFVDDIRAALDAGMDAHVAKPIGLDRLESTIRDVLEHKGTRAM